MMKSTTDTMIDADLAALGDASRHELGGIDASLKTTGVHPKGAGSPYGSLAYRDDRPGAEAKRASLADARRRELALMPLTLSHMYAHRVARATAGAAGILCGFGLLLLLNDRLLLELTGMFIPGFAIGMYALISMALVLGSYVVATWVAEHRFEQRMRVLVSTGEDVYRDLDQLAVGPFAVAAEQVRRIDHLAVTLPLAGLAILIPVTGYLGVLAGAAYKLGSHDLFYAVTENIGPLTLAILGAGTLALAVGRAAKHEASGGRSAASPSLGDAPTALRLFGHGGVLVVAMIAGLVTIAGTAYLAYQVRAYQIPSMGVRYFLACTGVASVMLPATWAILWWRRRERARLGD